MPIKLRGSDGIWKNVSAVKLRGSDGIWKNVVQAFIRGSDSIWKSIFSSTITPTTNDNSEITKATDSTSWLITLTGKYYHWYNTDVLDYRFERSIDSGATWTTIKSGLDIINPAIGSYETVVYQLDDSPSDVIANSENIYRFVVTGTKTSPYATNDNESTTQTVYGSEDVIITVGTITYTEVSFSWTASPNAQKYLIYRKPNSASSFTEDHYVKVISSTSTTIDSLSSNSTYDFMVIPITGVSNTYRGYLGSPAYLNDITTQQVTAPVQTVAPTKGSGTGEFGTIINIGSPGTYTGGLNVDTRLVYVSSATVPESGTTINISNNQAHPHPVDQADFTYVSNRYYTQDDVTAADGATHYYYYSQGITCYVDDMSDNFDRSNASGGLGTTSTGLLYDSNRSNYVSTWAVLNNKAYSSQSVSSNSPSNPMQAIEAGGKYDIIGGINYPNNGGGYGIAFWVTSANSWWAASTYYNQVTSGVTSLSCTGAVSSGSSCTNGSNIGDQCGCYISSTSYACNQAGGTNTTGCPTSSDGPGGVCNCSSSTITTPSTCSDSFSGLSFCPNAGTQPGTRCSANCTSTTTTTCPPGTTLISGVCRYVDEDGNIGGVCCSPTVSTTYAGTLWSASDSYTQYSWNTRTSSPTNTYSWNTIVETSTASTTYSSYIKVNRSNGSSVAEQGSVEVASSTSAYTNIPNLVLVTSGSSILVSAFNGATQIGNSLSLTGTAPSSSTSGVAAGVIKMATPYNEAGYIDNLQVLPS